MVSLILRAVRFRCIQTTRSEDLTKRRKINIKTKKNTMRHFLFYLFILFVLPVHSQTVSRFFKIEKISNNVYVFITPRPMADIVHGNSTIIVGEDGVLVIDTFGDDIIATEAIKEIKKITSKPVKYILNTHWHYDSCW